MVLSLGSNIQREKNIRFAIEEISEQYGALEQSPVYETISVGFNGPPFLNLVLGLQASEAMLEIRDALRKIEVDAGRVRGKKSFDSRILDIDIVLFGDSNLRSQGMNIPRDEIEKYAYVLKPLSDLYPSNLHPVLDKTFESMWQDFDKPEQRLKLAKFIV